MYHVYILVNSNKTKTYTGYTDNLSRRIKEHNKGECNFTKKYKPWSLFYKECYIDKNKAIRREKYLKSCSGRKFIKKLFNNPE